MQISQTEASNKRLKSLQGELEMEICIFHLHGKQGIVGSYVANIMKNF
jgi:hypothetical protein